MCAGLLIIERGRLVQTGTLDDLAAQQRAAAPAASLDVTLRALCDAALLEQLLRENPLVQSFRNEGAEWRVEVKGNEEAAAELLAALVRGNARVVSFHARRATLEDIFMKLTKGELA
jgi:ABC-type multidrug transport system ATPase subunit